MLIDSYTLAFYNKSMDERSKKMMIKDFRLFKRKAALYFDMGQLEKNFKFLCKFQNEKTKFLFPVKSFPHEIPITLALKYFDGLDVSNINEMNLAPKAFTWCSSPYVETMEGHDFVDINNISDLKKYSEHDCLALRVNTDFMWVNSRFGISGSMIESLLTEFSYIKALHVHLGTQENSVFDYQKISDFFVQIQSKFERPLHLNFGGGFATLDEEQITEVITYAQEKLPNSIIYFEPGRWLSQSCGYAVGKVLAIHNDHAVLSLSPNCHTKWLDQKLDVAFLKKGGERAGKKITHLTLSGPTCYENDQLVKLENYKNTISVDDIVLIGKVSGYAHAWNHSFNGIDLADVVFLNI